MSRLSLSLSEFSLFRHCLRRTLTLPMLPDKSFSYVLRDWRQRGIDHEGAQSIKTAERLGLLTIEVQVFLWIPRRKFIADDAIIPLQILP